MLRAAWRTSASVGKPDVDLLDTGSQQDIIWDLLDKLAHLHAKGVSGAAGRAAQVVERVRCVYSLLKLLAHQTVLTSNAGRLLMT